MIRTEVLEDINVKVQKLLGAQDVRKEDPSPRKDQLDT